MERRLVYITVATPFGPAEQFLLSEMEMLRSLGVRLTIVPRSPGGRARHRKAISLEPETIRIGLISAKVLLGFLRQVFRSPIVACSLIWDVVSESRNWRVAAKNLIVLPKAFHLAGCIDRTATAHIHAGWGTTPATIAFTMGRLTGIPWSMTLHRGDIAENNLLGIKVAEASFVRCISEGARLAVLKIVGTAYQDKIRVLHMGAEFEPAWQCRDSKGVNFQIVAAANLLPVKGLEYLIDACALLRDRGIAQFGCVIYGDGPLRRELDDRIQQRGVVEFVRLAGAIPHEDLIDIYRTGRADLFVLPSINAPDGEHEGIPVSLMEAMAWSIPVISTDTGSIAELLGENAGVMVRERDAGMLADAILRIISDADHRRALIENGRRVIGEGFDLRRNSKLFLDMVAAGSAGRIVIQLSDSDRKT